MVKEKSVTRHAIMAIKTIKAPIDSHPRNGDSVAFKEGRSIKEIYLTLNYSSPGTFTKALKMFYDRTPTEWVMLLCG
jgi:AraC-like DNA-binding protein